MRASKIIVDFGNRVMRLRRFFDEYPKEAKKTVSSWMNKDVKYRILSNVKREHTGKTKYGNTGKLSRAIQDLRFTVRDVIEPESSSTIRLIFDKTLLKKVPYAKILDSGGIIRPKTKRALAIPTDYARATFGADVTPASLKSKGVNLFMIRKGNTYKKDMLYMKNKGGSISGMFSLRKSAWIIGSGYYTNAFSEAAQSLRETMKKMIRKKLVR